MSLFFYHLDVCQEEEPTDFTQGHLGVIWSDFSGIVTTGFKT